MSQESQLRRYQGSLGPGFFLCKVGVKAATATQDDQVESGPGWQL